jgi:hypothetical protein
MAQYTSSTAKTLGDANNIREDLGNVIFNVSPFQTPFTSGIPTATATNDNHEWLTDSLAAAVKSNGKIEADVQTGLAGSVRTRKGNQVMIASKTVAVTQKAEIFDRAGVPGKEMAYQLMKLGKELQMDIEKQTLQCYLATHASNNGAGDLNATKRAATATVAGVSAAFGSWINTNQEKNGGTDNTASTGLTVPVVAGGGNTQIDQDKMDALLDSIWTNSGDFSNTKIMASAGVVGSIRNVLNGMASTVSADLNGNATDGGNIIARVAVYVSQFGPIAVVPNKHMPANTLYVMDYNTWGIAFGGGTKIHTTDIATQASAEQKLLESYYTLEARSEESNGAYYNIA